MVKRRDRRSPIIIRIALAVFSSLMMLLSAEIALRLLNYKPDWHFPSEWTRDDIFSRYTLKPGAFQKTMIGSFRVNKNFTRGPEFDHPGILTLGDSCTFGVQIPENLVYPFLLDRRPGAVINAGVPGYNSFLGLQWLVHSHILDLHPRLITVYYGWNDQRKAAATERSFYLLRRLAPFSRLAALALRLEMSIWHDEKSWQRLRWCALVPVSDFKNNLRSIVKESKRSGAETVLITAPFESVRAPPQLAPDDIKAHGVYADAVRQVAQETGAGLVDFDLFIRSLPTKDSAPYFIDYVHLSALGHHALAALLKPWVDCSARGDCFRSPRTLIN